MDEHILVIKRSTLTHYGGSWQGLKSDSLDSFEAMVYREKEFHQRSLMETDEEYKQIIPYLIFKYGESYFLMQRTSYTREQRLKNSYSLGIGGHVRKEDFVHDSLIGWARREFNEEVHYTGSYTVRFLGLINDDSNEVGRVHIGCALLLEGDSDTISIKSELKSGTLVSLDEVATFYGSLETWSQIVVKSLQNVF